VLPVCGRSWRWRLETPIYLRASRQRTAGLKFPRCHGVAQIKIIPGGRGDLSPAERREGLEQQERLPPIWHQIDKGIELVESQHRPFGGTFLARALIRHRLAMINSSSVTAVFKIARSRRYDLATMVEETPASSCPTRHSRTVAVSS